MASGRWFIGGFICLIAVTVSGCASMESLRQAQMDNRNLTAEKAQLEQEVYDLRSANRNLVGRTDSLGDQLASKEQLIGNLQRENDTLENSFRQAQTLAERIADRPLDKPLLVARSLPGDLDTALQGLAGQFPQSVSYDREFGAVKWISDLVFATGSDVVKDSAKDSLRRFSDIMKSPAAQGFDVIVAGHTDNVRIGKPATRERHPTNWHLSVHRAISVANELRGSGIAPTRVGVMGFGEYRPIAANDSEAARAHNRRVEVYVVPSGTFSAGVSPTAMSFTGTTPSGSTK